MSDRVIQGTDAAGSVEEEAARSPARSFEIRKAVVR